MRFPVAFLLLAGLAVPAAAQFDAAIFCSQSSTSPAAVVLFDSTSGTVTSVIPGNPPQASRGGIFGPRGLIYMGEWTNNGVGVLDPQTGTWSTLLAVKDPTNRFMGAPYQPAVNYDNVGGFGILCPDGNAPTTTVNPAPRLRNMFTVDYGGGQPLATLNSFFSSTFVPMSDMYPNLFNPGTFVGVGYYSSDAMIGEYPYVPNPPATIVPKFLAYIPQPSNYDATWLEDGNLWVFSLDVGTTKVFIQKADIRTGSVTNIPINGLPTGPFGAIWGAPWEVPGMKGWICSDIDDTIYGVDFTQNPIVATRIVTFPTGTYSVNTGREAEECQLSSWWISPQTGQRNFHLNFGTNAANQTAILAISSTGISPAPLLLSGLEIYLTVDPFTVLGLSGFLPYSPFATLDANGEADVLWRGVGTPLGLAGYFQAVTLAGGTFTDATNIISVKL